MMIDAVAIMAERKISELPVVDADGRPVGLIDITDVVALLPKPPAGPAECGDVWIAAAGSRSPTGGACSRSPRLSRIPTMRCHLLMNLEERCQAIELILTDVDGVLTDGRIVFDNQGIEAKLFHIRDGLGIRLWQRAGYRFGLITQRSSHSVKMRASGAGDRD